MSSDAELTAEFARLNNALDRASDIADRILGDFSSGNDNAIPISRESILDELGRLMRVTTELRKLTGELNLEANSPAQPANLSRTQTLWESVRDRYKEALDVWENLGETITGTMTAHLLAQHPRDEKLIKGEWEDIFPQEIDAQNAMEVVEVLGVHPRPEQMQAFLYPNPTPDQLRQELSDKYLLQMYYSLGMTQTQIGRLMGVGQAAAATRLRRANDRLEPVIAKLRIARTAQAEGYRVGWYPSATRYDSATKNRITIEWDHPPVIIRRGEDPPVVVIRTVGHVEVLRMPASFAKPQDMQELYERQREWHEFEPQLKQMGFWSSDNNVVGSSFKQRAYLHTTGELRFWAIGMYYADSANVGFMDNSSFVEALVAFQKGGKSEKITMDPNNPNIFTEIKDLGRMILEKTESEPETAIVRSDAE